MMLDGKFWVLFGADGLIGVTEDESRVKKILADDYQEETGLSIDPDRFGLKLKFDAYRLMIDGIQVQSYRAFNAKEV